MMYKLAITAGHHLANPKGCPKALDPNMTREWTLNARIVEKVINILSLYDGIELMRCDEPTGNTAPSFTKYRKMVNDWEADAYLGVHHNGLNRIHNASGITAYCHNKGNSDSKELRNELYNAAVSATGLKGDRASPLVERDFAELRNLNCPAVLMECGFMDSRIDCPIILTEEFADKMAKAFADVFIKRANATPKAETPTELPKPITKTVDIDLPILQRGAKNESVKALQALLNGYGFTDANEKPLVIDGSFGAATFYALKAYQNANNLEIDGSCGRETWNSLLK